MDSGLYRQELASMLEHNKFSAQKIYKYRGNQHHQIDEILVQRKFRNQIGAQWCPEEKCRYCKEIEKTDLHQWTMAAGLENPASIQHVTHDICQTKCNGKGPEEIPSALNTLLAEIGRQQCLVQGRENDEMNARPNGACHCVLYELDKRLRLVLEKSLYLVHLISAFLLVNSVRPCYVEYPVITIVRLVGDEVVQSSALIGHIK